MQDTEEKWGTKQMVWNNLGLYKYNYLHEIVPLLQSDEVHEVTSVCTKNVLYLSQVRVIIRGI
jgi:ferric iron reductase protein FhuF